jgi:hypothetical protein
VISVVVFWLFREKKEKPLPEEVPVTAGKPFTAGAAK